MDWSLPDSSAHGILQARILEKDKYHVISLIHGIEKSKTNERLK